MICKYNEIPDGAMCRPMDSFNAFQKKEKWAGSLKYDLTWEVKDDHIVEPNKKIDDVRITKTELVSTEAHRKTEGLTLGEMVNALIDGADVNSPWDDSTRFSLNYFTTTDGKLVLSNDWLKVKSFKVRYPEKKSRVITESEWDEFLESLTRMPIGDFIAESKKFLFDGDK